MHSFEFEEHNLVVSRTARYYTLGGSADCSAACFVLHGYGQLAEPFLRSCAALASAQRRVIAPEALSRFYLRGGTGAVGASWMTRLAREAELADLLGYLDQLAERECGAAGQRLELQVLGFSQGAPAAARWALRGRVAFHKLILWSAAWPADVPPAELVRRGLQQVLLVHGDQDANADLAALENDLKRLRQAGLQAELLRFEGGHELSDKLLAAL